jgi:hypothetical protein
MYWSVVGIKALKRKIFVKLRNIGKIMKDVKMPTSRSYQDYLISSLKTHDRAAGNIEVALELEGKDP